MHKGRLEAFTDGVIAVIITIMVLEMKAPPGADLAARINSAGVPHLCAELHQWNNHHHMLQVSQRVGGRSLWANMFLLFWLSLVPFVIRWMEETDFAALPTAAYGLVLMMAAIGFQLLQRTLIARSGADSTLAHAVGRDLKGKLSMSAYAIAIGLAFIQPWIAIALYVAVAIIWFVPDRRIESIF
jgi:uncharacterized membrane protein